MDDPYLGGKQSGPTYPAEPLLLRPAAAKSDTLNAISSTASAAAGLTAAPATTIAVNAAIKANRVAERLAETHSPILTAGRGVGDRPDGDGEGPSSGDPGVTSGLDGDASLDSSTNRASSTSPTPTPDNSPQSKGLTGAESGCDIMLRSLPPAKPALPYPSSVMVEVTPRPPSPISASYPPIATDYEGLSDATNRSSSASDTLSSRPPFTSMASGVSNKEDTCASPVTSISEFTDSSSISIHKTQKESSSLAHGDDNRDRLLHVRLSF